MDQQTIKLILTLEALDIPLTDIHLVQHAIYLAQAAGIKLGYFYHWQP